MARTPKSTIARCQRCTEIFETIFYTRVHKYCPLCAPIVRRELQRICYRRNKGQSTRGPKIQTVMHEQIAWTDFPIVKPHEGNVVRKCIMMEFDGHRLVRVFVENKAVQIDRRYLYTRPPEKTAVFPIPTRRLELLYPMTRRQIRHSIWWQNKGKQRQPDETRSNNTDKIVHRRISAN